MAVSGIPELFLVVGADRDGAELRRIYSVSRGRNGGASIFRQFSGDRVARCTGGGFDLVGTVLADALTVDYGVPQFDGGRGLSSVISNAERYGVNVFTLGAALHALPAPTADSGPDTANSWTIELDEDDDGALFVTANEWRDGYGVRSQVLTATFEGVHEDAVRNRYATLSAIVAGGAR